MLTTYQLHLRDRDGKWRFIPIAAESVMDAMRQSRELFVADKDADAAELNVGESNVISWTRDGKLNGKD